MADWKKILTSGGVASTDLATEGSANYCLVTDGSGSVSWVEQTGGVQNIIDDTTPQLGGDLDVNDKYFEDSVFGFRNNTASGGIKAVGLRVINDLTAHRGLKITSASQGTNNGPTIEADNYSQSSSDTGAFPLKLKGHNSGGVWLEGFVFPTDHATNAGKFLKSDGTWASVSDNNDDTTYSTSWVDSSNDVILRFTAGGSGPGNDDLKLVAGDDITLTPNGDDLTIAYNGTDDNTTYAFSAVDGVNANEEILRLNPSSGSNDEVTLIGAGTITTSRSGNEITLAGKSYSGGNGLASTVSSSNTQFDVGVGPCLTVTSDEVQLGGTNDNDNVIEFLTNSNDTGDGGYAFNGAQAGAIAVDRTPANPFFNVRGVRGKSYTDGVNMGGDGSSINLLAGDGGQGYGANQAGGNGGNVVITAGSKGTGPSNGAQGQVLITRGTSAYLYDHIGQLGSGKAESILVVGTEDNGGPIEHNANSAGGTVDYVFQDNCVWNLQSGSGNTYSNFITASDIDMNVTFGQDVIMTSGNKLQIASQVTTLDGNTNAFLVQNTGHVKFDQAIACGTFRSSDDDADAFIVNTDGKVTFKQDVVFEGSSSSLGSTNTDIEDTSFILGSNGAGALPTANSTTLVTSICAIGVGGGGAQAATAKYKNVKIKMNAGSSDFGGIDYATTSTHYADGISFGHVNDLDVDATCTSGIWEGGAYKFDSTAGALFKTDTSPGAGHMIYDGTNYYLAV